MGKLTHLPKTPKIIIAPLDWGLGHATRCIPIIYELLKSSCEVLIAAEGAQKALLEGEFPGLRTIGLRGYRLAYGNNGWQTRLRIGLQIPKIVREIRRERAWLREIIISEKPDAIISDNRFGLYANGIPTVFITHQLHIKTGMGSLTDRLVGWINHRYIRRFAYCWIPDIEGPLALSGELGHPARLPAINTRMIGHLSRFGPCENAETGKILIILSGPEPQRTILEVRMLAELQGIEMPVFLVRGLPAGKSLPQVNKNVTVCNHLQSTELKRLICESSLVISRSGYSTIMELMKFGKKSILIPTAGQPEQEYLAERLFEKKWAFRVRQKDFKLKKALEDCRDFAYASYAESHSTFLEDAVGELIHASSQKRI